MRPFCAMDGEEPLHLRKDPVERAGFEAAFRLDHVAVHRIAAPHHGMAFALNRTNEPRQAGFYLVMPETADERDPARFTSGVERVEQPEQRIGFEARPTFHADGIADTAQEFHVRATFETGAVA